MFVFFCFCPWHKQESNFWGKAQSNTFVQAFGCARMAAAKTPRKEDDHANARRQGQGDDKNDDKDHKENADDDVGKVEEAEDKDDKRQQGRRRGRQRGRRRRERHAYAASSSAPPANREPSDQSPGRATRKTHHNMRSCRTWKRPKRCSSPRPGSQHELLDLHPHALSVLPELASPNSRPTRRIGNIQPHRSNIETVPHFGEPSVGRPPHHKHPHQDSSFVSHGHEAPQGCAYIL